MSRYPLVLCLYFLMTLLLFPASAMAKTLTAEDLMNMPLESLVKVEVLVTGASKYAEKISESPSIVQIITSEDIRNYGYRTLGDALNGIHGIYTSSDRMYNTVGVRGFLFSGYSNSRILIMIDGRRMNENVYDSVWTGEEFMLDMDLVDHIEYIPGPGSTMYGANAMMGIVNVITRKGSDINGVETYAMRGNLKTGAIRATLGKKLDNGADILLSGSGYDSAGEDHLYYPEYDFPGNNGGVAKDMDHEANRRLFAKVNYKDWTYTAGYVHRNKTVPTALYGTNFNDPGTEAIDAHAYGEFKYNTSLNDKSSLEVKGFYHWYESTLESAYTFFFPYILQDIYGGDWIGGEANFVTTVFDGHKIVIGGDWQYDINQFLYSWDLFGVYQNTNRNGLRSGIYLSDSWAINDKLILNAGIRFDQHHMVIRKIHVNPRLGLIWNPKPSTTVKLLYGSAFRAPNVYERDYDAYTSWADNPHNKEEHVKNYEIAADWRGKDGLKISGSVFYNDFNDFLNKDYNGGPNNGQYINSGQLRSIGYDINAEKKWDNGREIKLAFNHTDFIFFNRTAWDAVDAPNNVGKLQYFEPFLDGRLKLGLENIYVGKRKTLYSFPQKHSTPAYNLTNMNINVPDFFPEGIDASLTINNLFNATRNMVGPAFVIQDDIPMNGRTFYLTFRKRF